MNITIPQLQAYLAQHYQGDQDEQGFFMKLVEEVGEVAEVLNQRAGRKVQDKADLDLELVTELADILHYTVAIAAVNGLDLNRIILEKDKRAAVKYQHEMDLETFLKAQRKS
ncbi:MazG nucleotide pyrophosphohydrolase domain-containing protein [Streptococcus merionis]|uniref:MazG nucleotide pyrophosphohydrolase domain-containing protein n=1 Tax=Streptococcus merionis TaxID=400065 RepID=A0A239ST61_9STRE|nr:MazG nucleotide pyrophosphohydrolase domain-containing protein [Streptococcus merionis]SNU88536.1 MazG nucleotide pyrophosphohydrolase domain-containing protein [Streptococcus merionis]